MEEVEVIDYRGHQIKVYLDTDPQNPREDMEDWSRMLCFHNRYELGDFKRPNGLLPSDFGSWKELEQHLRKEGAAVILPLYLYDHSGLTMSTSEFACRWDSGQVGFIYITRSALLKYSGRKRLSPKLLAFAKESLEKEVKIYDQFLRGEIYEYAVDNPEPNLPPHGCCGFYNKEEMIQEAKQDIDAALEEYFRTLREKYD